VTKLENVEARRNWRTHDGYMSEELGEVKRKK
jgi:hypothetical protein